MVVLVFCTEEVVTAYTALIGTGMRQEEKIGNMRKNCGHDEQQLLQHLKYILHYLTKY